MSASLLGRQFFLEGLATLSCTKKSNNRSVMPLDVLGLSPTQLECTLFGHVRIRSQVSLPKSVVFHSCHSMVRSNLERTGRLAPPNIWNKVQQYCTAQPEEGPSVISSQMCSFNGLQNGGAAGTPRGALYGTRVERRLISSPLNSVIPPTNGSRNS